MGMICPPRLVETDFGFEWGELNVSRLATIDGRLIVGVGTTDDPHRHVLEIHLSPKARTLAVYIRERRGSPQMVKTHAIDI